LKADRETLCCPWNTGTKFYRTLEPPLFSIILGKNWPFGRQKRGLGSKSINFSELAINQRKFI